MANGRQQNKYFAKPGTGNAGAGKGGAGRRMNAKKFGFFDVLTKPAEVFAAEKQNANFKKAAINYSVIPAILGVIIGLIITIISIAFAPMLAMLPGGIGALLATLGIFAIIIVPIVLVITQIVGELVLGLLIFVASKVLGGNGTFMQQFYLKSTYAIQIGIVGIVASILGIIPVVGFLVAIGVAIYTAYLLTLAQKEAHGFSILRAIVSWILPMIIVVVIVALVVGFVLIGLLMAAGAMQGQAMETAQGAVSNEMFCSVMMDESQCTSPNTVMGKTPAEICAWDSALSTCKAK